ncbi:DUF805 domain-containing protein [Polaribacter sp. ALD11]|uniref:DUF805 domain-containing protein n=1 Tax=Polaribacter sp. ALD11 TaxID=2058137 RepID=UPI000C313914|nr:DUF805 domain-containing protein [Polaribacter sp. ALD11]AUC84265.1 DUF805 domain-containing protein [Polaribacter sp. ALD11]
MNWYLKVLKEHYADFNGRARREEYWMFVLFNAIVSILLVAVFGGIAAVLESPGILFISYIYFLGTFIPSLALTVRRLHDVGKSGWFLLIGVIPLIGSIWLLVLYCTDSENGTNQWGENPKARGNREIDAIGKE